MRYNSSYITERKIGWFIANVCYRIGDYFDRIHPHRLGNRIVSYMEQKGICCERHAKIQQQLH